MQALSVRALDVADAAMLAQFLAAQPHDYLRYFTPFAFDEPTVSGILARRVEDIYEGLFWQGELVGFFMLRGWDEGYSVPSYGVVVGEAYNHRGLGRLTLELAKVICRLRGCARLMLKVHPENAAARHLYEQSGFHFSGIDGGSQQRVYHFEF